MEPHGELNSYNNESGDLVIELEDKRGFNVKYIFTEE